MAQPTSDLEEFIGGPFSANRIPTSLRPLDARCRCSGDTLCGYGWPHQSSTRLNGGLMLYNDRRDRLGLVAGLR